MSRKKNSIGLFIILTAAILAEPVEASSQLPKVDFAATLKYSIETNATHAPAASNAILEAYKKQEANQVKNGQVSKNVADQLISYLSEHLKTNQNQSSRTTATFETDGKSVLIEQASPNWGCLIEPDRTSVRDETGFLLITRERNLKTTPYIPLVAGQVGCLTQIRDVLTSPSSNPENLPYSLLVTGISIANGNVFYAPCDLKLNEVAGKTSIAAVTVGEVKSPDYAIKVFETQDLGGQSILKHYEEKETFMLAKDSSRYPKRSLDVKLVNAKLGCDPSVFAPEHLATGGHYVQVEGFGRVVNFTYDPEKGSIEDQTKAAQNLADLRDKSAAKGNHQQGQVGFGLALAIIVVAAGLIWSLLLRRRARP